MTKKMPELLTAEERMRHNYIVFQIGEVFLKNKVNQAESLELLANMIASNILIVAQDYDEKDELLKECIKSIKFIYHQNKGRLCEELKKHRDLGAEQEENSSD